MLIVADQPASVPYHPISRCSTSTF
jgi:hypothetical protein